MLHATYTTPVSPARSTCLETGHEMQDVMNINRSLEAARHRLLDGHLPRAARLELKWSSFWSTLTTPNPSCSKRLRRSMRLECEILCRKFTVLKVTL